MNQPILDRILRQRMKLILDQPFFGVLAMNLPLIEDSHFPTMATNGACIRYNPDFITSLTDDYLRGVLAHEVLHCALRHPHRRDSRNPERWNIACDYAVNNFLDEYNTSAVQGGRYTEPPLPIPDDGYRDPGFAALASEEIYAALPTPSESEGEGEGGGGRPGPPSDGDGDDSPGPPSGGEGESKTKPKDPSKPEAQGWVDDAPGTEAEKKRDDELWRGRLAEAAMAAQAHGKLPASLRRLVDKVLNPELPWTDILRNFIRSRAEDDYSWRRPSKKTLGSDLILPSLRSERMGELVVAVDTSGSIDADLLNTFMGEMQGILDECRPSRLILLDCDAAIHQIKEFTPGDHDLTAFEPQGGGGTDFRPVFKWIADENLDPVAVIYFTDLMGTFPDPQAAPWPTLWVDYGGGSREAPFGETIRTPQRK
jgi:predicted metal-dependent peptidase